MLPNLQKHVRYDPVRDFSPIAQMVGIAFVLIVHPSVQAKSAEELVRLAKARPGKLEYSSGGLGSAQQLAMELFMSVTGVSFVHVPYKGAPQAAMEVVSGQIPVALAGVPITVSLIKQGRLRALGVASDHRLAVLPETPTLAEQARIARSTRSRSSGCIDGSYASTRRPNCDTCEQNAAIFASSVFATSTQ